MVTANFVGGPWYGQSRNVPCDDRDRPPPKIMVPTFGIDYGIEGPESAVFIEAEYVWAGRNNGENTYLYLAEGGWVERGRWMDRVPGGERLFENENLVRHHMELPPRGSGRPARRFRDTPLTEHSVITLGQIIEMYETLERGSYISGDQHSVQFSKISEEAEKEMEEWDKILKGK